MNVKNRVNLIIQMSENTQIQNSLPGARSRVRLTCWTCQGIHCRQIAVQSWPSSADEACCLSYGCATNPSRGWDRLGTINDTKVHSFIVQRVNKARQWDVKDAHTGIPSASSLGSIRFKWMHTQKQQFQRLQQCVRLGVFGGRSLTSGRVTTLYNFPEGNGP